MGLIGVLWDTNMEVPVTPWAVASCVFYVYKLKSAAVSMEGHLVTTIGGDIAQW